MIRIEDIIEKVEQNRPNSDVELIRRAYIFSARNHRGQKRASGEPYLIHPLEVADILADMRLDEVSVSTGLLHDVVEDTLVELDTIRRFFGEEIWRLCFSNAKKRAPTKSEWKRRPTLRKTTESRRRFL